MNDYYGAIEAGGTKFVCAIGDGEGMLMVRERLPTETPDRMLPRVIEFFRAQLTRHPLRALGIGSFGPVDPRPGSVTFGHITTTPKPGWRDTDFAGALGRELDLPVGFDTDVNAAALAEWKWGAGRGLDTVLYVTVGTGIGGGLALGGRPHHGLRHPEMGHMRLPHDMALDPFPGICPFHGDCLEGLASGPAIEARWGAPAERLPPDHAAWALEAQYLGLACHNWMVTLSPSVIVLGGGVMKSEPLLRLVRENALALSGGYMDFPEVTRHIDRLIVGPRLGDDAGIKGALLLAIEAAGDRVR